MQTNTSQDDQDTQRMTGLERQQQRLVIAGQDFVIEASLKDSRAGLFGPFLFSPYQ